MMTIGTAIFWISITYLCFKLGTKIHTALPHPFTLPLLITSCMVICLLLIANVPYETYMVGGSWLSKLLGPGVVALAVPLYRNMEMLKKHFLALAVGISIGTIVALVSTIILVKMVHVDTELIMTIIPKSVTLPVALALTEQLQGIPALTTVFVMLAGLTGALIGPTLLDLFKINHYIGRGISYGCGSHIIGTTRAMKDDEKQGVVSSVTLTLSAILTSFLAPFLVHFFL